MIRKILDFYRTGPDRPVLQDNCEQMTKVYAMKRWSVFLGVTIGYSLFYICRLSISIVKKPILDAGILDARQLGAAGSAFFFTYAFGKMVNGFLADRSNIKHLMSTGLLISSFINLALGFKLPAITFITLWGINGWFQSMGAAPGVVSISQWFSNRELGTRYGIWSTAHCIGESITFYGTAVVVSALGWNWGFGVPGMICLIAALLLYLSLADRPQTYGLPPVSEYRNDCPPPAESSEESTGKMQMEVLRNPNILILGLASACMYVARYGINSWGILYLQVARCYSLKDAGIVLAANTVAGIFGAASSGFISDKFFNSRRNIPVLIFGLLEVSSLILFFLISPGNKLLDILAMSIFGFAMGALLVFLGGLIAVDISSQKATGAAMGVIGVFSYVGAAIQEYVSGSLIESGKAIVNGVAEYSFDNAFYLWIGSSILSLILASTLWNAKSRG